MNFTKAEIQQIIDNKVNEGVKKYGKDFKFLVLEILGLEKMITPTKEQEEQARIIPLSKWNDYHAYPTVKSLRMKIFHNANNFANEVIERDGKRILINEKKYFEWHKKCNLKNT